MAACRQPGSYESQLLQLIVVKRARPWPLASFHAGVEA